VQSVTPFRAWRRRCLLAAAVLVFAGLAVVLDRSPTLWADSQLYAAIARSRQLYGVGVPSSLLHSPYATDHTRFYGPVFFQLAAWAFDAFGISKWSFRLVSLFGALLIALAGGALGRLFGQSRDGWLWPLALLIMAPEIGLHARTGSMDTLAVGLELTALACFVRAMFVTTRPLEQGMVTGLFLALAALTTPRTYPFIGALVLWAAVVNADRRWARIALSSAVIVCGVIVGCWAWATHGSPLRWLRFMTYIALHENADVAVLPSVVRKWSFSTPNAVSPMFAIVGAVCAGWALARRRDTWSSVDRAVAFALLTTATTFVVSAVLMNLTFTLTTYCAIPLFAVVAALPRGYFTVGLPRVDRRLAAAACAALLWCDATVIGVRAARIAASWSARETAPLEAFLKKHVPADSDVIGPFNSYFFVVEQSGAHFWMMSPQSWADWARWVPQIEPEAVGPYPRLRPPAARFFIWETERPLPPHYGCGALVATYVPPPPSALAGVSIAASSDTGYPQTDLYRLPDDCPDGYDPTGSATAVPAVN